MPTNNESSAAFCLNCGHREDAHIQGACEGHSVGSVKGCSCSCFEPSAAHTPSRPPLEADDTPIGRDWVEWAKHLETENERLRTWLSRIRNNAQSWHGADPDGIDHAHHGQQKALNVIAGWCEEALNGE